MPHVVLRSAPSVWQKLKGKQPTHQTATVWKLTDYDEAVPLTDASTPMPDMAQASSGAAMAEPSEVIPDEQEQDRSVPSKPKG